MVACALASYGYGGYGGYVGYGPGIAHHPYGGSSYVGRTVWGFPRYKREASEAPKADDDDDKAYAKHPDGGLSFVGRTVWGFPSDKKVHKREAEPSFGYGYGPGIAHHPYGGTSYVGRTVWGFPSYYH